MNLTKAVEINKNLAVVSNVHLDQDDVDAIKLGLEASNLILAWRKALPLDNPQLLPGETED